MDVRKSCFCLFVGVLIGVIIGIVFLNMLISFRIDIYCERIKYLENIIEDKEIRLAKLEESINNEKIILKEIEIVIMTEEKDEEDLIDKITLEKHIKEKYSEILGREVKSIDIDLIGEVIDKRIMQLDGKEYQLFVDKIVLTEILKIWVAVEKIENSMIE